MHHGPLPFRPSAPIPPPLQEVDPYLLNFITQLPRPTILAGPQQRTPTSITVALDPKRRAHEWVGRQAVR